jgi:hypothetical protein
MGQVKQALMELEDFVAGCLREGRTLNQTIRDKQLEAITCACDKIKAIDKYYPDDDDIPF